MSNDAADGLRDDLDQLIRVCLTNLGDVRGFIEANYPKEYTQYGEGRAAAKAKTPSQSDITQSLVSDSIGSPVRYADGSYSREYEDQPTGYTSAEHGHETADSDTHQPVELVLTLPQEGLPPEGLRIMEPHKYSAIHIKPSPPVRESVNLADGRGNDPCITPEIASRIWQVFTTHLACQPYEEKNGIMAMGEALMAYEATQTKRESVNLAIAANAMINMPIRFQDNVTDRFRMYAKACAEAWGLVLWLPRPTSTEQQTRREHDG